MLGGRGCDRRVGGGSGGARQAAHESREAARLAWSRRSSSPIRRLVNTRQAAREAHEPDSSSGPSSGQVAALVRFLGSCRTGLTILGMKNCQSGREPRSGSQIDKESARNLARHENSADLTGTRGSGWLNRGETAKVSTWWPRMGA